MLPCGIDAWLPNTTAEAAPLFAYEIMPTNVKRIITLSRGAALRSDPWNSGASNKICGIHADTDFVMSGGSVNITASDDGIHADNAFVLTGGSIEIKKFVRFEKGEGIEKRQDDFAAEVASMVQ